MDTEAPKHTNWWWGEVTKDVARLYIQATDSLSGIARVACPTSTQSGGYNNWVWFETVWDSGANAYRADITPATFGHYEQTYTTHLYIWDNAGNGGYYNATNVNIPEKESRLYLYNLGDQCTSVTGGWYFSEGGAGYLYYESDHMEFGTTRFESTGGNYDTVKLWPKNKLSVTGYTKLYVEYRLGNYSDVFFGAPSYKPFYGSDFSFYLSSLRRAGGYYTSYANIQDVGNVMFGIYRKWS